MNGKPCPWLTQSPWWGRWRHNGTLAASRYFRKERHRRCMVTGERAF